MTDGKDLGTTARAAAAAPLLPLVSIVTPAHNEEQHLAECVESVLAQTYPNWDYTIVENCSTDNTRAIAEKYAAQDPRIRVVCNQSLLPAVPNFNLALRQRSSASKYCKMILADDWIFPECLERMVAVMEKYPSVGIVGAYGLMDPWVLWTGLPYANTFISGREICRQRLMGGPYIFGSQTSVLLRSDLIGNHQPFYNESSDHPDSEACMAVLREHDFGFVHQVLTFSRKRAGSLLSRSQELNTLAASRLHELVTYGPYYLDAAQYADRLGAAVSAYYEFLARSLLHWRGSEFWEFHRRTLESNGVTFSRPRLAGALGKVLGGAVLRHLRPNPNRQLWGLEDTGAAHAGK